MEKLNKRKAKRKKECPNLGQKHIGDKNNNPVEEEKLKLLAVGDVASMFACSTRTIWRLADSGSIPSPVMRIGKVVRWSYEEINQWIEDGCPITRKIRGEI